MAAAETDMSVFEAAVLPVSCTLKRSRNTTLLAMTPWAGLAFSAACQPCVFSASSSMPNRKCVCRRSTAIS